MSDNKGIPERIDLEKVSKSESVKKELRTEKISVFLTKTEKEEIVRLSRKYGLRMSSYLRFRGVSDFAIAKGRGIERIKKSLKDSEDPLMVEMKKGFTQVVSEIKKGFKEGRKFLKPIPIKEQKEIQEQREKRMKRLKIETFECEECKNSFEQKDSIQIERYKNTQIIKSEICPECFEIIKEREFIKLI